MTNYSIFIKNCIKKKYSGATSFDSNLIHHHFKFRKFFLDNIRFRKKNVNYTNDIILYNLMSFYYKQNAPSIIKNKMFLKYYKNFNIFLRLKNISKKKTNPLSYIYLGGIILREKKIDKLHKLNFFLKLLDVLFFEKCVELNLNEMKLIKKIVKYEKKLLSTL